MDFLDRLQHRDRAWWKARAQLTNPRTIRRSLHYRHDLRERRFADDPEALWRCCDAWPRKLLHKWNSREFCVRYGCTVPALYAYAVSARDIPFDDLPDRYVVRPVRGMNRKGTVAMVGGYDLLGARPLTSMALMEDVETQPATSGAALLVEEFIDRHDGSGRLPIEFKCHTFGRRVAAIERIEREHGKEGGAVHRYYTHDWVPYDDPMETLLPPAAVAEPPPFLDVLVASASRLGETIGTYMRIDFFGSAAGPVFNEFSSVPSIARPTFTPHCRELFGQIWDETFPDAV